MRSTPTRARSPTTCSLTTTAFCASTATLAARAPTTRVPGAARPGPRWPRVLRKPLSCSARLKGVSCDESQEPARASVLRRKRVPSADQRLVRVGETRDPVGEQSVAHGVDVYADVVQISEHPERIQGAPSQPIFGIAMLLVLDFSVAGAIEPERV